MNGPGRVLEAFGGLVDERLPELDGPGAVLHQVEDVGEVRLRKQHGASPRAPRGLCSPPGCCLLRACDPAVLLSALRCRSAGGGPFRGAQWGGQSRTPPARPRPSRPALPRAPASSPRPPRLQCGRAPVPRGCPFASFSAQTLPHTPPPPRPVTARSRTRAAKRFKFSRSRTSGTARYARPRAGGPCDALCMPRRVRKRVRGFPWLCSLRSNGTGGI